MKPICGIYGLKNKITGKWYVGQSVNIHERWKSHAKKYHTSQKLSAAISEHGFDSFEKLVLEECANEKTILDSRESFWIDHYDSVVNGYNTVPGPATIEKKAALMEAADTAITAKEVASIAKTSAVLIRLTDSNKAYIDSAAKKLKLTTTEFITMAAVIFANKTFEGKINQDKAVK